MSENTNTNEYTARVIEAIDAVMDKTPDLEEREILAKYITVYMDTRVRLDYSRRQLQEWQTD